MPQDDSNSGYANEDNEKPREAGTSVEIYLQTMRSNPQ